MDSVVASYIKLGVVSLLPAIVTILLFFINKNAFFSKINKNVKQIIYGLIFGIIAIFGTEYGIPINGAQINCRDGAVLTAGLLFGGPAGIIAGVLGGVERWLSVYWGVGSFTRIACSVSTILAGFYSAALRRFLFENKKPGWIIAFAIGVVMEVFHLTMVFITNMAETERAMAVVKACTVPMLVANGLSVMFSTALLEICSKDKLVRKPEKTRISVTIQRWLLFTVLLAFGFTSYFVYSMQNTISVEQREALLKQSVADSKVDVEDAMARGEYGLVDSAYKVAFELTKEGYNLNLIADNYSITEINVVNNEGIVVYSNISSFIGYDMHSASQSLEFVEHIITNGESEYVQDFGAIGYDDTQFRKYVAVKTDYGFLQVGCNYDDYEIHIEKEIKDVATNCHIGETGYIIVVDEDYNIVSAPSKISQTSLASEISSLKKPRPNKTMEMTVKEELNYIRYDTLEKEGYKYFIVSFYPKDEAIKARNVALYVNTFMEILAFAVMFGLIYRLIEKVVVKRIESVNESLSKITKGDLEEIVDVRTNEEFVQLSNDINSTVGTLKRYIDEASKRIDKELEFAKNIQTSALPSIFPAFPKRKDFDIYATMNPAKEVGGDFYDFYLTDENKLNFLIADVSGKGIPAAMFMMRAKTELKSLTEAGVALSEVFTHGNNALCEGNDAGMFVTAWQGGINLKTGQVEFVNAGHNPPLIKRSNGKFEYLKSKVGFVLAGMEGVNYKKQEISLKPGDVIYLYTDGVTEATDLNNELYGEERLLNALNSKEFNSVKDICAFVKQDVDKFVGEASQFDDITMVALKYNGEDSALPSIGFDRACLEDIDTVTDFIEAELEKIGCSMKSIIQIKIAVDEIYSNIVRYGYSNGNGPIAITIYEKDDPHSVHIKFVDKGIPYNPLEKADPNIKLSAEERDIGGLGIFMVKKTMDNVKYKYENNQNILTIIKNL